MRKKNIQIIDSTLRDGEQAPGVVFFREEKLLLAKMLSEAGISWIEAGIPAMGLYEQETLRQMGQLGLMSKLSTWNRMLKTDVNASVMTEIKDIHLSISVSDIQIKHKLKKNRRWVLEQTRRVVTYAQDKGLTVSVGAEDASRADFGFLEEFLALLDNLEVHRFRYADTVGALEPLGTAELMKKISRWFPKISIDFHGHNDFGLATANALAAATGGAEFLSCTVNRLGERAGNAALEEVAVALEYLYESETGVNKNLLSALSKKVAYFARRKIAPDKPIVGSKVFTHESGIHVDGLLKTAENYEFLSPLVLGRKHKIVLGKFSGLAAVKELLREQGLQATAELCQQVKESLQQVFQSQKKMNKSKLIPFQKAG